MYSGPGGHYKYYCDKVLLFMSRAVVFSVGPVLAGWGFATCTHFNLEWKELSDLLDCSFVE